MVHLVCVVHVVTRVVQMVHLVCVVYVVTRVYIWSISYV